MSTPSKNRRVTLQDIAQRTGYTVNTVSRALKNKADISRATCETIQRIADEMGYIRNQMASSLRSGRTRTLGLVVGGMSNPYYGIMADQIQNAAMEHGYSVLILCSRDQAELEMQVTEAALSRQVDGILLFPCYGSEKTIERIRALGVPFVLMGRTLPAIPADAVICDEEQGAFLITRHLIEAGCRELAYLSNYDVVFSSHSRLHGYRRACQEAGMTASAERARVCNDDEAILRQLFAWKQEGVDGLFLFCDDEAWRVMNLLAKQGMSVPSTFAVAGFDNIQGVLPFPSPLCSVEYGLSRMAYTGVDLLLRRINNEELDTQLIRLEPRVICHGSCGIGLPKRCPAPVQMFHPSKT